LFQLHGFFIAVAE